MMTDPYSSPVQSRRIGATNPRPWSWVLLGEHTLMIERPPPILCPLTCGFIMVVLGAEHLDASADTRATPGYPALVAAAGGGEHRTLPGGY